MSATEVAPGVRRICSGDVVNLYLVEDGGRVAAIDAGLPPAWDAVKETLGDMGRTVDDLEAILLTHAHIDHTGFAERARREADVTVYAPEGERELLDHQLKPAKSERTPLPYLKHASTRKLIFEVARSGAWQSRPIRDYVTFTGGDELADVPGRPRVVATPGHTFGHASLHFADRDVLFTGDSLVTRCPYTNRRGPRIVARAATADVERARSSLDAIAATRATTLLPGHGEPWTGGAEEAARLAREAEVP
jgi:glyoxylase-like metal-dependent hydrolase (beta-lactamase superfamily II)